MGHEVPTLRYDLFRFKIIFSHFFQSILKVRVSVVQLYSTATKYEALHSD
ncbi:hypothetical protein GCWU000325_00314 [Alloprevotella tannerae ATCC 51259]|uniref:Uncharacterized protein n=1 Tax=Alloprevotella tannerae ATCC 51259 TaxID=626522 RepID=C9LDP2_9BACT|nr:hypothetical protein GCWU000325_00314 [Alloprevotella tannerae ATCC 51259]